MKIFNRNDGTCLVDNLVRVVDSAALFGNYIITLTENSKSTTGTE